VKVFVTGASGYIGGAVALRLIALGADVVGLTRTADKAQGLEELGIAPLIGELTDAPLLARAASEADVVVNAANADDSFSVEAFIAALRGTGKRLVQTSGASLVADRADGEPSDRVFHEDTPVEPLPERAARAVIDRAVLAASHQGIASVVIRPALIHGRGRGLNQVTIRIPMMIELARRTGVSRYVGRGMNRWSSVHIDDLADLYVGAIEHAPAGSLFYAESDEIVVRDLAEAVAGLLGLGPAESWPMSEALPVWGAKARTSFASNNRISAAKARAMLGWAPTRHGALADTRAGGYYLG
jgi:nucleoside-diphosphate-sugar epimerase